MQNKYNRSSDKSGGGTGQTTMTPKPPKTDVNLKGSGGVFDHNPSPGFNKPRETSGMLPQKFGESDLGSAKMGTNPMNTALGSQRVSKASAPTSSTVKTSKNKYNSAGKTKQQ